MMNDDTDQAEGIALLKNLKHLSLKNSSLTNLNFTSSQAQLIQANLQAVSQDDENIARFIRLVKRYTEILNAFIDKIIVGETKKEVIHITKKGRKTVKRSREIRIIYKFVGTVTL